MGVFPFLMFLGKRLNAVLWLGSAGVSKFLLAVSGCRTMVIRLFGSKYTISLLTFVQIPQLFSFCWLKRNDY